MIDNNSFNTFLLLEYLIILVLVIFIVLLSMVWNIFFVKRIISFHRKYRECLQKAKSDPFGNFSEAALHHRFEIVKYVLLLLINVTEFISAPIYVIGSVLTNESISYNHIYSPNKITIQNCTNELIHSHIFDLKLIYEIPINAILVSTGRVAIMLSLALGICLMKYLHEKFHNINSNQFAYISRVLVVAGIITVSLIITGSVPQLIIIHYLIEPIVQFLYLGLWAKHTRILYRTLKWRSFEFRARREDERLVRRSVISCYQFALIMWCMGIGYVCLISSDFLEAYLSLISAAVYYGPCLFNYLYGTAYYNPLLVTLQQIQVLHLSYEIETIATTILIFTAIMFIGLQYILCTAVFFGGNSD